MHAKCEQSGEEEEEAINTKRAKHFHDKSSPSAVSLSHHHRRKANVFAPISPFALGNDQKAMINRITGNRETDVTGARQREARGLGMSQSICGAAIGLKWIFVGMSIVSKRPYNTVGCQVAPTHEPTSIDRQLHAIKINPSAAGASVDRLASARHRKFDFHNPEIQLSRLDIMIFGVRRSSECVGARGEPERRRRAD